LELLTPLVATGLAAPWAEVRIEAVDVTRVGDDWAVAVRVALGAIAPEAVRVELRFRFARAERPSDYGSAGDSRALSVAFAVLQAVPARPGQ
jgi:hypothetical protein